VLIKPAMRVLIMTDVQTTKPKVDVLEELLDVYWTYEELLALLPDDTCHRLLKLVNERLYDCIGPVSDVFDAAPDLIPDRSLG